MRGGAATTLLRAFSLALEFALVWALTQALGAGGYGMYAYCYALMRILAIPAQAGLPTLVVRDMAIYSAGQDWGKLKGLLLWANRAVVVISVSIGAGVGVTLLAGVNIGAPAGLILWALGLIPLVALGNIRGAALRGLNRVVLGQVPESIVRPSIALLALALCLAAGVALDPQQAMVIHIGAAVAAFATGVWLLMRWLPPLARTAVASYDRKRWMKAAVPLSMVMGMNVLLVQAPLVSLGYFGSAEDVGAFAVAYQLAMVLAMPATIANLAVAPQVARLAGKEDVSALQRIVAQAGAFVTACSLIGGLILAGGAGWLLEHVFGEEFVSASEALTILACAYAAAGLSGVSMIALNMTGHERSVALCSFVALVINLISCVTIVPTLGIVGAALSASVSLIALNVALATCVALRLRVNPTPTLRALRAMP